MLRYVLFTLLVYSPAIAAADISYQCQCGPYNNGGFKCDLVRFEPGQSRIDETTYEWGLWGHDDDLKKFVGKCSDRLLEEQRKDADALAPQTKIFKRSSETVESEICELSFYDNIGLTFSHLSDRLLTAIAKDPLASTVEFQDSLGRTVQLVKPFTFSTAPKLKQAGQQDYLVCVQIKSSAVSKESQAECYERLVELAAHGGVCIGNLSCAHQFAEMHFERECCSGR